MIKYKKPNNDPKVGSAPYYYVSEIQTKTGETFPLAFTQKEIDIAMKRGKRVEESNKSYRKTFGAGPLQ